MKLMCVTDVVHDIRLFWWTGVDNYEWHQGFGDARFGLVGFDPVTRARTSKRSALWLRDTIARAGFAPSDVP